MADDFKEFTEDRGGIHIYERGTPEYEEAIVHRFPNGISEVMRFVVEPDNDIELRALMENLGETKRPFGLKSGGHISIPKIRPSSQLEGILISMKRFNLIKYDKDKKTLDVGAGVIWTDVYKYLEEFESASGPDAPGVVGGNPLVGVSGWLLGGGYSLLTNRFGLGIDSIIGFRVILPSEGIRNISREENPELFVALKGGGHNFGIITQFTLRVHDHAKRTESHSETYSESQSNIVKDILVKFIEWQKESLPQNQAAVITAAFRHDFKDGKVKSCIPLNAWNTDSFFKNFPASGIPGNQDLAQFFFSGGSSLSLAEAYEAFSLRHLPVSLETLKTDFQSVDPNALPKLEGLNANLIEKKLLTLLQEGNEIDRNSLTVFTAGNKTVVMESPPDLRGRMACIMVTTYTRTLIDEAEKRAKYLSLLMAANNGIRVSFEIWPFHKKAFDGVRREDAAWPHEEGNVFGPLVGWFEWSGRDNDKFWLEEIEKSLKELRKVALQENCTTKNLPMYLNIALENTPVTDIYRDHYEKLKDLRRKYDPKNVMGLAAGFVIDGSK